MHDIGKSDVMEKIPDEHDAIAEHIKEHLGSHGPAADRRGEYGNRYGGEHH